MVTGPAEDIPASRHGSQWQVNGRSFAGALASTDRRTTR
jgi:hypothetical protein